VLLIEWLENWMEMSLGNNAQSAACCVNTDPKVFYPNGIASTGPLLLLTCSNISACSKESLEDILP
jgi:hypothetical protein